MEDDTHARLLTMRDGVKFMWEIIDEKRKDPEWVAEMNRLFDQCAAERAARRAKCL